MFHLWISSRYPQRFLIVDTLTIVHALLTKCIALLAKSATRSEPPFSRASFMEVTSSPIQSWLSWYGLYLHETIRIEHHCRSVNRTVVNQRQNVLGQWLIPNCISPRDIHILNQSAKCLPFFDTAPLFTFANSISCFLYINPTNDDNVYASSKLINIEWHKHCNWFWLTPNRSPSCVVGELFRLQFWTS